MPPSEHSHLDRQLLAAHAADDKPALARLYDAAADFFETSGDVNAACFYLTHAYVYALETGPDQAITIHTRLVQYGREE